MFMKRIFLERVNKVNKLNNDITINYKFYVKFQIMNFLVN